MKQTVFAHHPGGGELARGDEAIFAWARFEIEDFIPELFDDVETVGLTVYVGGDALRTWRQP